MNKSIMAQLFGIAMLWLLLVNCAMSDDQDRNPTLANSTLLAEDIDEAGVLDTLQSTLSFDADLNVSGNGGCNRYFGSTTVDEDEIAFGPLGNTRMACSQAIMDQEQRLLGALESARTWRIDAARDLLYLDNEEGRTILRFSRLATPD